MFCYMILHQTAFIFTFWSIHRWISPQQTLTVIWQIMLILFVVSWSIACFLVHVFDAFVGYCNDCSCILSGILDIPVYKNRIHSLHVLFTLYSEFKNSQVIFRFSTILNYIWNMPISICKYNYFLCVCVCVLFVLCSILDV